MRYSINFDKMVNQLVPHYLGGRKLILYLQALMHPLQSINEAFNDYAKELRIDYSVTSQIGYFEWYLNRKFSKYFKDSNGRISIKNAEVLGVPLYYENANVDPSEHVKLYTQSEGRVGTVLKKTDEVFSESNCSFTVTSPAIDPTKIKEKEYLSLLNFYIEKYRIGNKTYKINYNS